VNSTFRIALAVVCLVLCNTLAAQDREFETISFPSTDELSITADVYAPHEDKTTPFIVLCHQAGWSRGEYREIAPKLNELGFNCMAIDQRSGGAVNKVANATLAAAEEAGAETGFLDAQQDIVSALKYTRVELAEGKVILWGSSYSAALSLVIAGDHNELVDGVLAFAPGEYFVRFGKAKDFVQSSAAKIAAPAFITSAKNEFGRWEAIYNSIEGDAKQKFVPETAGNHGSRALWEQFSDNEAYWASVKTFLAQFTTE
jgi:pimeloyl-ACP methyl ester carboxylesterase